MTSAYTELEQLMTTWLTDCQYSSMKRHDARYIIDKLKSNLDLVLRELGGEYDHSDMVVDPNTNEWVEDCDFYRFSFIKEL